MNNNFADAARSYQQDTAISASAVGGVVALYDTILRDFRRATAAVAVGNIETRVFELNHALTVIAELYGVLDYERGNEAAKRFARFYEITRGLILAANIRCTSQSVQQLIELYTPVRNAWKLVDQKLPHSEMRNGFRTQASISSSAPAAEADAPRARWNA